MARSYRLDEVPPGYTVPDWYKGPITDKMLRIFNAEKFPPTEEERREYQAARWELSRRYAHLVKTTPEPSSEEDEAV